MLPGRSGPAWPLLLVQHSAGSHLHVSSAPACICLRPTHSAHMYKHVGCLPACHLAYAWCCSSLKCAKLVRCFYSCSLTQSRCVCNTVWHAVQGEAEWDGNIARVLWVCEEVLVCVTGEALSRFVQCLNTICAGTSSTARRCTHAADYVCACGLGGRCFVSANFCTQCKPPRCDCIG